MSAMPADVPAPRSAAVMAVLSRVGRSLMLPIAALPAAAILLRAGQEDMLGRTDSTELDRIASVIGGAGGALFDALPLLFAVGVAIGFARRSDGSTALAAVVGYLVWDRVTRVMFFDSSLRDRVSRQVLVDGVPTEVLDLAAANPTRVLGGILIGLVTAVLWQRYHRIRLPAWLAFFGGRRFVPIVTAVAALALGVCFGLLWPPIGERLAQAGDWLATHAAAGAGIYGVVNRLLVPLGLHHFVNSIVWFTVPECSVGATHTAGDLQCYFAGQDGAGAFMAGFFPVMMFGLPAAALAIWRAAPAHRRASVGSIMVSAALVSFVTGITEPIEFAFVFVAPVLFAAHALLTGVSMGVVAALDGRLGFGFSAGAIDAVLNAGKANTHNFPLIMVIGLGYAVVYYLLFRFLIHRLNIMTPGREPEPDPDSGESGN